MPIKTKPTIDKKERVIPLPQWASETAIQKMLMYLEPIAVEPLSIRNQWLVNDGDDPLTIRELALVAIIHVRSVIELDGFSPVNRFIGFSRFYKHVFPKPWTFEQITTALGLLEFIKFTKRVTDPIPPKGKTKGTCARYELF